jgi:hypothetical protein
MAAENLYNFIWFDSVNEEFAINLLRSHAESCSVDSQTTMYRGVGLYDDSDRRETLIARKFLTTCIDEAKGYAAKPPRQLLTYTFHDELRKLADLRDVTELLSNAERDKTTKLFATFLKKATDESKAASNGDEDDLQFLLAKAGFTGWCRRSKSTTLERIAEEYALWDIEDSKYTVAVENLDLSEENDVSASEI